MGAPSQFGKLLSFGGSQRGESLLDCDAKSGELSRSGNFGGGQRAVII
jgi:hypothetical protein